MTDKRFKFDDEVGFIDMKQCGGDTLTYQDVAELLNELSEENNELKFQLNSCSAQRDEFHRGARENANRVGKLKKENEQLKAINKYLIEILEHSGATVEIEHIKGDVE